MTVKTLVPSGKDLARTAGDKLPKTNGEASPFQGILRKEMERSRPAVQAPAPKAQPVKDDGKAQNAPPALLAVLPKKTEPRDNNAREAGPQDLIAQQVMAMNNQQLPVQNPTPEVSGLQKKNSGEGLKVAKTWGNSPESTEGSENLRGKKKPRGPHPTENSNTPWVTPESRVIQVLDRRTSAQERGSESKNREITGIQDTSASAQKVRGQEEVTIQYTSTAGFTPDGAGGRIQAPVTRAAAEGLFRSLQDKANLEIVDKARIVLRDDNQGEIRLVIKPEALGEVRIRLNLDEGRLAGQIIVENNTVKDVFQNNMSSLLDSFREGGFTGLDIQVSVGSEGNSQEFRERTALLDSYVHAGASETDKEEAPGEQNFHYWQSGQLDLVI